MSDLQLEIRILTMKDALDRQSMVKRTISSSNSLRDKNHEFFFAVRPADVELHYDEYKSFLNSGRTLSPAECSCYASHYEISNDFLRNSEAEFLLVVEDDIYIDPYFCFENAIEMMNSSEIDYLRLFCRAHAPARTVVYEAKYQIVRYNWSPGGTQAYLLSRSGARKLADHIRTEKFISRPIDIEMDRSWATGNTVFAIFPQPALEFNIPTTIHSKSQIAQRATSDNNIMEKGSGKSFATKARTKIADIREKISRKIYDYGASKKDRYIKDKIMNYFHKDSFQHFQKR